MLYLVLKNMKKKGNTSKKYKKQKDEIITEPSKIIIKNWKKNYEELLSRGDADAQVEIKKISQ